MDRQEAGIKLKKLKVATRPFTPSKPEATVFPRHQKKRKHRNDRAQRSGLSTHRQ